MNKKRNQDTPLICATQNGFNDCIPIPGADWNSSTVFYPPIMRAAQFGYTECVDALIEAGADVNALSDFDDTPLELAAVSGNIGCVESLIDAGADVNRKGYAGNTALLYAAQTGHTQCVEVLTKAGAALKRQSDSWDTALLYAAVNDYPQSVDILIKAGADVNCVHQYGSPVLHRATINDNPECVKLLLEAGADVNALNPRKEHSVVHASDCQSLELFLKAGADVNSNNRYGFPLIIIAARHGRYDCLKLLIEAGADVNTIVSQAATPLHALVKNLDKVESKLLLRNVKLLLRAGANVNIFRDMTTMYFNQYEHNALRHYIIQCPAFNVQPYKKVCMLLCAAGETVDGCTIRRISDTGQNEKAHVSQFLLQKKLKLNLKHIYAEKQSEAI